MASSKFQYNFIEDPDDALKCSICLEVARGQPMQHGGGCGRLFCKECIEKNGNKPCPMCRGENPQYFEDTRSVRDIKSLRVRCEGCEWIGTVGTLEDHVTECEYTLVECTNKCSVEGMVICLMRKDLENHVKTECPNRAYQCKYCREDGIYTTITRDHDQLCLKKPVPCPNTECPLTVERGRVEEHVASECEHTIVACKYSNIGCPERNKRKDIKTHEEDDRIHLRMSLNTVSQLNNTVAQLNSTAAQLNSTVAQLKVVVKELANTQKNKMSICVDVHNFTAKREADEEFDSEPFFTIPSGYKMRFSVYCNGCGDGEGTHLSVFTELLDVPYKDQLKWPFRGTVTFELLNQLENNNHHEENIEYANADDCGMPDGDGLGCHCFIPLSSLAYTPATSDIHPRHYRRPRRRNATANTPYLDQDTLHFRLTVKEEEVPLKQSDKAD